ncbi:hypothetical protein H2203_008329 [Taxawa tesnikishii (nom. ined.)]|nr:hypothetical protein H2203_008329 [Dothideales sp. JES 119]
MTASKSATKSSDSVAISTIATSPSVTMADSEKVVRAQKMFHMKKPFGNMKRNDLRAVWHGLRKMTAYKDATNDERVRTSEQITAEVTAKRVSQWRHTSCWYDRDGNELYPGLLSWTGAAKETKGCKFTLAEEEDDDEEMVVRPVKKQKYDRDDPASSSLTDTSSIERHLSEEEVTLKPSAKRSVPSKCSGCAYVSDYSLYAGTERLVPDVRCTGPAYINPYPLYRMTGKPSGEEDTAAEGRLPWEDSDHEDEETEDRDEGSGKTKRKLEADGMRYGEGVPSKKMKT